MISVEEEGGFGGTGLEQKMVEACSFYFLFSSSLMLWAEEAEALRKETRLLLGLCLDSRARYRASNLHLNHAREDYQGALNICRQEQGETHPQVSAPEIHRGK